MRTAAALTGITRPARTPDRRTDVREARLAALHVFEDAAYSDMVAGDLHALTRIAALDREERLLQDSGESDGGALLKVPRC